MCLDSGMREVYYLGLEVDQLVLRSSAINIVMMLYFIEVCGMHRLHKLNLDHIWLGYAT